MTPATSESRTPHLELLAKLRLLQEGRGAAFDNMAMDEALMRNALHPVLRFYGWREPTVSLGYFCGWAESRARHGKTFNYVRRWTGGGTVEHGDGDATYSLVLPMACPWGQCSTAVLYKAVHSALAAALGACGVATDAHAAHPVQRGGACFQHPVVDDLLVSGRKIAGAAIRRSTHGVLLQGSIQGILVPKSLPGIFAQRMARSDGVEDWQPAGALDAKRAALVDSRYGRREWNERR